MALSSEPIAAAIRSHIAAGGHVGTVFGHEPKSAPVAPGEIAAGVWFQELGPTGSNSSLNATDALVIFMARFYLPMLSEPQDSIDPRSVAAVEDLLGRLDGDFTLGGVCDYVDLLGMTGQSLRCTAGYVEIDRVLQRVIDVTIPVVVNDVWTQAR